jgi:hypothetical protein
MRPIIVIPAAALALGAAVVASANAQGNALDRRVTAVANGLVEFNFASNEQTCGDGLHFMRTSEDSWYGNYINTNDPTMRSACVRGPLRVLVTMAEREVVRIETFIGPVQRAEGATNLGAVPAREASTWLLGVAARSDGRPARDAILPAVLADSSAPTPALLAIARDQDRARDTRRSAISWLVRAPDASSAEAARTLGALARDERDAPAIRQAALSALIRLPQSTGITALTQLAAERQDLWLGSEATKVLARSGDPRARAYLRTAVADARLPEDLRAAAIAGLGNDMATGADGKLLRDTWRSLGDERTKNATLTAVAAVGGSANAEWLMTIARDQEQTPVLRRKAVALSERAGATGTQLSQLYEAVDDTETRGAVITAMGTEGSKPSRDKLLDIAKSSELPTLRRRAITALNRFDSPEVREALAAIAGKP